MSLRETMPRPPVDCLLMPGGPAAVRRFVIAVGIDAVDGMLRSRSNSHVGQEILETVPALADNDSTTGIVFSPIHRRSRRSASGTTSGQDSAPDPVFPRLTSAVCSFHGAGYVALETAATGRVADAQSLAIGNDGVAAFTHASPQDPFVFVSADDLGGGQSSKSLIGNVDNRSAHWDIHIMGRRQWP